MSLFHFLSLAPSGAAKCSSSGVSMPPGAMATTRMPRSMYSSASDLVSWTTPPFDAQYAAW